MVFRLFATIILLFTQTEGTHKLRCSCTLDTSGTHKLWCSCTFGTGGTRYTTVRASGPYRRYGYRRSAPYHVLIQVRTQYRVCCGLHMSSPWFLSKCYE